MNESRSTTLVLYVEDEETDRFFMEMAFQKAGIAQALRTAVNGKEAIDYLSGTGPYADRSRHPLPGLVLLDINPTFDTRPVIWVKTSEFLSFRGMSPVRSSLHSPRVQFHFHGA